MASGIDAPEEEEGFTNPDHPYYQYEASLGWLPKTARTLDSTYQYVAGLRRKEAIRAALRIYLRQHLSAGLAGRTPDRAPAERDT